MLCSNGSIYIISPWCNHLHNAPIHLDRTAAPFKAPGPADYRIHTQIFTYSHEEYSERGNVHLKKQYLEGEHKKISNGAVYLLS